MHFTMCFPAFEAASVPPARCLKTPIIYAKMNRIFWDAHRRLLGDEILRTLTTYAWHTGKLKKPMELAVVTDLHNARKYDDIWPLIDGADCLLVAGDVVNRYFGGYRHGIAFLNEAARRLPTFFSIGNHELRSANAAKIMQELTQSKATVLLNQYAPFHGLWIGGWYPPELLQREDMLDEFEALEGCKVLLCHRPHDYMNKLRERSVDLVIAGHAHGGQIRIKGQGLYSPGQGFLPKYTKGVVDNRMIVCAGTGSAIYFPRWGNPFEVLRIMLD